MLRQAIRFAAGVLIVGLAAGTTSAQEQATGKLAKAAQNPVSDLISLPLQNNTFFGIGPDNDIANILNIQPVVPVGLGEDWNLITRTIAPIIYLPDLLGGLAELPEGKDENNRFGLGDINATAFLSPARPGSIIWGVGPSITLRTATDQAIGSGKWSVGPSAVVLSAPSPWVYGVLARQLWSFAGDDDRSDVSQLLIQPFVNFNLPAGWYLVSSPVITASWEADNDDRWNTPIGGGFGRIFKIGTQPVNTHVQGFWHAEHPHIGPAWTLRLQVQFLFPK